MAETNYTLREVFEAAVLAAHPVGSYLFTSNSADPATYMGGGVGTGERQIPVRLGGRASSR
jgi:hypothetical protein